MVIAHLLALFTLLYSLEKSFGFLTKALRKVVPSNGGQSPKDAQTPVVADLTEEDNVEEEARVQQPRWVRGVETKVRTTVCGATQLRVVFGRITNCWIITEVNAYQSNIRI